MSFVKSIRGLDKILPASLGGSGRQKVLALIGDRILDLVLYEQLIRKGYTDEGVMTQHRSMVVANSNLAKCALQVFHPETITSTDFSKLSNHERGTLVEASLGAVYEEEHFILNPRVRRATEEILEILRSTTIDDVHVDSEFQAKAAIKKAKSALLELMQRRGVISAASFFTVRSVTDLPTQPPFVATFEPTFSLVYCGLPDTGPISGLPCATKKDAEESASTKVLEFFHSKEKQGAAPNDCSGVTLEGALSLANNSISTKEIIESQKNRTLEEGEEEERNEDIERKKKETGALVMESIKAVKERG